MHMIIYIRVYIYNKYVPVSYAHTHCVYTFVYFHIILVSTQQSNYQSIYLSILQKHTATHRHRSHTQADTGHTHTQIHTHSHTHRDAGLAVCHAGEERM